MTSCMPSLARFSLSLTRPMRRLARGLSDATIVFFVAACPRPSDKLGTIDAPSPTATRLLIASTLSNSMTGFGGRPPRASQSFTVRRSAECSLPRISGSPFLAWVRA